MPKPAVYTVKRGDTFFKIAAWFHITDTQAFYDRNLTVVGGDWNLIFPGERLTLTTGM